MLKSIDRTKLILYISVALYGASLVFPAIEFTKSCRWPTPPTYEIYTGFSILLTGGFGLIALQFGCLGWLANPLYFIGLISAFKGKFKRNWLPILSLFIAILSISIAESAPIAADEGVVCRFSALTIKLGYWLWLGAISLLNIVVWKNSDGDFFDINPSH